MTRRSAYALDEQGVAAVEFALVVPVMLMVLFAIFHLCFMTYATNALHWAVEQAARCASVGQQNKGVACSTSVATGPSKADVQNYAAGLYKGPLTSVAFTASEVTNTTTGYCRQVTGTGNYQIVVMFINVTVPVSATSCFPEANTGSAWT